MNLRSKGLLIVTVIAFTLACSTTPVKKEAVVSKKQSSKLQEPNLSELASQAKPQVWHTTLKNGLQVFVIENHTVPLITIEIAVKAGAFTEPPEWDGLMHFYEHMFFKGNEAIPNQTEYMKTVRRLGMVFNGTTSTEVVRYFFTLPVENFAEGLEFMYNAIAKPLFDPTEIEKEKGVVLSEMDRNDSNPRRVFSRALDRALFYKYPERRDTLGKREVINSVRRETLQKIKSLLYVPNNAALIIAGDIDHEQAFKQAQAVYERWQKGPDPFKVAPVPEHPPLPHTVYITVKHPQANLAVIEFIWHGPSVRKAPEATYAADVLSYYTSLKTSGFYKRLIESGTALQAGFGYYTLAYNPSVSFWVVCKPEKIKDALAAMESELTLMSKPDYIEPELLERAKRSIVYDLLYSRQRTRSYALDLGFWWAVAGLDYYQTYAEQIAKVTPTDIAKFLKTYVLEAPSARGVLINPNDSKSLVGTPFENAKENWQ